MVTVQVCESCGGDILPGQTWLPIGTGATVHEVCWMVAEAKRDQREGYR